MSKWLVGPSCVFCLALLTVTGIVSAQGNPPPSPAAAIPANPQHEALKREAETAYQNNDFAKCIELTGKVLGQNPKDHVALYLRASARVELGQVRRDLKEIRGGIEDAREALRHGGVDQINYYLPYFYGMTALSQLENRKEHATVVVQFATTLLNKPNVKPEDKANLHYQRAAAHLFLQDPNAAAQDYEAATLLDPTHLGARLGLADTYLQMGKPDKAEAAYTGAVQAAPSNPLVYNNRGMFFQGQGKTQQAVADFTRAIELDNTFGVAYTNRGFALMNEGNPAAAEQDFAAAMKLDPTLPLPYSLRGTARLSQGNTAGAIEDYSQVLKFDAKNPIAHADLGFARYFAGDYAGAATEFDQAVTLDANLRYLDPWRYWTLVKAGQGAAANTRFAEVLAKPADQRDWVDNLLAFLGDKLTAEALIAAADPKDQNLKNAQHCEARYFAAEKKAAGGDAAGATAGYQETLATKQAHLSAYRGAQYALKQFTTPASK